MLHLKPEYSSTISLRMLTLSVILGMQSAKPCVFRRTPFRASVTAPDCASMHATCCAQKGREYGQHPAVLEQQQTACLQLA